MKPGPDHYERAGEVQPLHLIEALDLNFHLGNVIKYVCRAGHKEGETEREALEKALWYLERYLGS